MYQFLKTNHESKSVKNENIPLGKQYLHEELYVLVSLGDTVKWHHPKKQTKYIMNQLKSITTHAHYPCL